jgi:sulfur carrier protein
LLQTATGACTPGEAGLVDTIWTRHLYERPEVAVHVTINGEQKVVPEALTVRTLLEHLGVRGERVAVEVNLEVVKRATHSTHAIKDGDAIEIVSFVGGG